MNFVTVAMFCFVVGPTPMRDSITNIIPSGVFRCRRSDQAEGQNGSNQRNPRGVRGFIIRGGGGGGGGCRSFL